MYNLVGDIKELTIGTEIHIYNVYTGKYNEHEIRARLIFRNFDKSIRSGTETLQEYADYKGWLRYIFGKGLIYKLKQKKNEKTKG